MDGVTMQARINYKWTPAEARLIKQIIAMVNDYPDSVRTCLVAHDSLMSVREARMENQS